MNIFILTADEPCYTKNTFEIILEKYKKDIVGVSFPPGTLTWKRVLATYKIYGLWRFFTLGLKYTLSMTVGGKVCNLMRSYNIPVYKTKNINAPIFPNKLRKLKIELILSVNCPQILKKDILNLPRYGCVNVHFGLLPKYRGILPIFYAIVNNEDMFGVTVHYMDIELDNGPIIVQERIKRNKGDDLFSLYPKAFKLAGELLIKTIASIESGEVTIRKNNPAKKTYYSYPDKEMIKKYREIIKSDRKGL